jgi:hypothetical protein
MQLRFKRFFSVDSPKAIKAESFGFLNAINYMAPASAAGVGNLCPFAGACTELCLGLYSGQAAMRKDGESNLVVDSRIRKAKYFMLERAAYMAEMALHTAKLVRRARKLRLKLCVRPNGSTDISYEGIWFEVSKEFAAQLSAISGHKVTSGKHTILTLFPRVQFVDYTKNPNRFNKPLPSNYYLTFSVAENNRDKAKDLLSRGVNAAAVFANALPRQWNGFDVIDGDKHDLRHLDPKASQGVIVGLLPKGNKAKRDQSGFVIRDHQ